MRYPQAFALFMFLSTPVFAQDGSAIYRQRCASCHDGGVARAPQTDSLKQMSAENVQSALIGGAMQIQALGLTQAEIRAVSEFVTGKTVARDAFPKQAYCGDAGLAGPALDQALTQPH